MSIDFLYSTSVITPRDRQLLRWLFEHSVLTTDQISRALFHHPTTARHRLTKLLRWKLVARFRWHPGGPHGGANSYSWVIGPVGARLIYAERGEHCPRPDVLRARREALAASPILAHTTGANDFFIALIARARRIPDAELSTWMNPTDAARAYSRFDLRLRCDGHGIYAEHGTTTAFFLEHDHGTEGNTVLLDKVRAYERATTKGWPAHPVLFWLHSAARERHLHATLARHRHPAVPIFTAVRHHHGPTDPGEAVWMPSHTLGARYRLADLSNHHIPEPGNSP